MKSQKKSDEGRFESEKTAFFTRVYKAYQHIAKRDAKRVARIDPKRSIEEVHEEIVHTVKTRLSVTL